MVSSLFDRSSTCRIARPSLDARIDPSVTLFFAVDRHLMPSSKQAITHHEVVSVQCNDFVISLLITLHTIGKILICALSKVNLIYKVFTCLLYTSDAADD